MNNPAQAKCEEVLPQPNTESMNCGIDSAQTRNELSTKNLEDSRFRKPFSCSDNVLFQVECRQVHVSKVIVCANSPVFDAMLNGGFSEKNKTVIPLADDCYDDFTNLMTIIHPPLQKFGFTSE